jgi:hypothetical protein
MTSLRVLSRLTAWQWWAVAIGVILLGFADLSRGGETIAPILLVLGYCVLIPAAILR